MGALGEGEYDADPWCPSPLAINHPSQWRKRGTKIEALQVQHNTSNCWTKSASVFQLKVRVRVSTT